MFRGCESTTRFGSNEVVYAGTFLLTANCGQNGPLDAPFYHRSAPTFTHHVNRLAQEHSPYLLQHQHNPVEWYPWGKEAFAKAAAENKLVLVSIGYSACHWCHVMERETFENPAAAEVMNRHFINIKVDRQQRPDVDQIYMSALHLMHQQGGWPLNCITLPDGRPVYGGTYFRTADWLEILQQLATLYSSEPEKVTEYADRLEHVLHKHDLITTTGKQPEADWPALVSHWKTSWDFSKGGSAGAPKFPMPGQWQFALDWGRLHKDPNAVDFAHQSLHAILRGGISDQLGGGTARYAVDDIWKVPHFEKMLYDNGQLLQAVSNAYQNRASGEYKRFVRWTIEWLETDMAQPSGLYASALDADSEGVEGKFYVWTADELRTVWGTDFDWARDYFSVGSAGIWEHGNYIPLRSEGDEAFAKRMGWTLDTLDERLDALRAASLAVRNKRIAPGLDTVEILAWNGLTLSGMAAAALAQLHPEALTVAKRLAAAITTLFEQKGHLPREPLADRPGFLDDYAACALGLLDLYRITQDEPLVTTAHQLLEQAWTLFGADQSPLCWYSADLSLITRKQENFDNVIPAANSMMARACFKLGTLLGEPLWMDRASDMLHAIGAELRSPGNAFAWGALHLEITRGKHLCISGYGGHEALAALTDLPPEILISQNEGASILPPLQAKQSESTAGDSSQAVTFYICSKGTCAAPLYTVHEVRGAVL